MFWGVEFGFVYIGRQVCWVAQCISLNDDDEGGARVYSMSSYRPDNIPYTQSLNIASNKALFFHFRFVAISIPEGKESFLGSKQDWNWTFIEFIYVRSHEFVAPFMMFLLPFCSYHSLPVKYVLYCG